MKEVNHYLFAPHHESREEETYCQVTACIARLQKIVPHKYIML